MRFIKVDGDSLRPIAAIVLFKVFLLSTKREEQIRPMVRSFRPSCKRLLLPQAIEGGTLLHRHGDGAVIRVYRQVTRHISPSL